MGYVTCSVLGCDLKVIARSWCSKHYDRWKRYGDPLGGGPERIGPRECAIEGCIEPSRTRGWCVRHYQKWYHFGDPETPDKYTKRGAPLKERIEASIVKTGQCWFWIKYTNSDGYGVLGSGKNTMLAHRASYTAFVGTIPQGLVIDHLCRNRACVNPDHLEPVTHTENVRRGNSMIRKTNCINGHEFSEDNVRWIRVCIKCSNSARSRYKIKAKAK